MKIINKSLLFAMALTVLGSVSNIANAALISETWDVEVTVVNGDYATVSVGDMISVNTMYDDTGTFMDWYLVGRLCLFDSMTTGTTCDEENYADLGWNIFANASVNFTNMFDTSQVLIDGNVLSNPGMNLDSQTFLANDDGTEATVSYGNSILMSAIDFSGPTEFAAVFYYQNVDGVEFQSLVNGVVTSRMVMNVSSPTTLAMFALTLCALGFRKISLKKTR